MMPSIKRLASWFLLLFLLTFPLSGAAEEQGGHFPKVTVTPILDLVAGFQWDDANTLVVPAGGAVLRGGLGEFRGNPGPSRKTFNFYVSEFELDISSTLKNGVFLRGDIDYSRDAGGAGGAGNINLEQALLTIPTHWGRGLELTVGRVNDPTGIENEDRHENATLFYSWVNRATPNNVTGLRLSYPFSDVIMGQLLVVNNLRDSITNDSPIPSFEGVLTANWGDEERVREIGITFDAGPERPDDNRHWQYIADAYLRWSIVPALQIDLEGLYSQMNTAIAGAPNSKAYGGYLLVNMEWTKRWESYARYGFFNDLNAAGEFTGQQQRIHQGSAGLEFRLSDGVQSRLEYQLDLHQPVGGASSLSHAAALEFIYSL